MLINFLDRTGVKEVDQSDVASGPDGGKVLVTQQNAVVQDPPEDEV